MLKTILQTIQTVTFPADCSPVERTVAESVATQLLRSATVRPVGTQTENGPHFHVAVEREGDPDDQSGDWVQFKLSPGPSAALTASHAHWLYAGLCLLREEWLERDEREFEHGKKVTLTFPWLRNLSDFLVGSLRYARNFNPEDYVRQIARLGFSHVSINGLGFPGPFEKSPPGDLYHWFYDYSPDLDQFVDSSLLHGYYPADYLQTNLRTLKRNADLAAKYGLIPGLHINSPRSMPEEFWDRYGFLRGARVDHPRETIRPRYTPAMAHPAVQDHYRELVRKVLAEIPEIGFIHVWTNDSGSGFEFVCSLYAGRNGGPYLLREWKTEEEIARVAAKNVLTYYRLIRDEARRINPGFRLVCDLGPFFVERKHIVPGLGDGIDAGEFAFFQPPDPEDQGGERPASDVLTHVKLDLSDTNVLGLPFPGLVHERLTAARAEGAQAILCSATPDMLAPFDVNGEIVRAVQLHPDRSLATMLLEIARRWAGRELAQRLVDIWLHSDGAVRAYPRDIPMSTFGFPWFRLWVRPFVPNIEAISEEERAYYERYLLATFNNPARVDLNNDMMWDFLTVEEAAKRKSILDGEVLPRTGQAIELCESTLSQIAAPDAEGVLNDLRDRLRTGQCYFTTMRNTLAWTESVHGFLESRDADRRAHYHDLCKEMVRSELENARSLLDLWQRSTRDCIPVSTVGESLHMYGQNFGELLERKIDLMIRHRDDEPYIDPDFMWRMPDKGGPEVV